MRRDASVHLLLLTLFIAALTCPARAETRIALVIGNGAYTSGSLGSPKDDSKAIEAKLKSLGFEVTRKTELRREELFDAIRDFGNHLQQPGTVGLFYYSGHGMQVNNRNYMIPIDADIRSDLDVGRFAVPVDDVLVRMEVGKSNPNFVILDACRNNPFEKRYKASSGGLAPMDAPPSTLIAFAAAPGRVAEAGSGGSLSLYTAALVEFIDRPYPNVISMFQAVQNAVYTRSGGMQSPRLELAPGLPDFSFMSSQSVLSHSESRHRGSAGAAAEPTNAVRITILPFGEADPEIRGTGHNIKTMISLNLAGTSRFNIVNYTAATNSSMDALPDFARMRQGNVDELVVGRASIGLDGKLKIEFRLWDAYSEQQLTGMAYFTHKDNWMRIANVISDAVYKRVTGEESRFDAGP